MKLSGMKYMAAALVTAALVMSCQRSTYDVVVIGGGVSGTAAAIRSARMGARTIVIESTPWLGGMLTSAGVSATDGNYKLRGGMWGEFRDSLEARYGGAEALKTGWVSNILFEPHVGAEIFANMAKAEKRLDTAMNSSVEDIEYDGARWHITVDSNGCKREINARVVIDATELGDIAAMVGVGYGIGMDSRSDTGEDIAPTEANGIIQDLTMVMVLKDYGRDMTIERPEGYTPDEFACCCINSCCRTPKEAHRMWSQSMLMSYGQLPGGKYMINWPIEGNDFYVNMIEMSEAERAEAVAEAKARSLRFLYFLQNELGYRTFYLADDEFPTDDLFPFIPYHRESRRIDGAVRFTLNHITDPYEYTLYRTAIGVGDYPVDQHHTRYSGWEQLPNLYFHSVPSYGVPMGVMLPKGADNLIVAEKSISVTNIVNGSTRLQPVVMQIGEAAGITAAVACDREIKPSEVSVREVQRNILAAGGYLLPFLDRPSTDEHFAAMQRIGVTGIIESTGMTVGWENQTWFRADEPISAAELCRGLSRLYPQVINKWGESPVTASMLFDIFTDINGEKTIYPDAIPSQRYDGKALTRLECAVIIDRVLAPFDNFDVDIQGNYIRQ